MKNLYSSLLAMVIIIAANAQSGNVCNNAISITQANTCNPTDFTMSGTEMWFSFVANNTNLRISVLPPVNSFNTPFADIQTITLFGGACNGLTSLNVLNFSLLFNSVDISGAVPGTTYFLRIVTPSAATSFFSLCVRNITFTNQNPPPCTNPLPCELICNGNMEEYTDCPQGLGDFPSGIWSGPNTVTSWLNPTHATSDYFACGSINAGVPDNFPGCQMDIAPDENYAGIVLLFGVYTEYIQQEMISAMLPGITYFVQMNVSLAEYSSDRYADGLEVYFSNDQIIGTNQNLLPVSASLKLTGTELLNDNSKWVKICGTYTATGGEQWITIGNFGGIVTNNGIISSTDCDVYPSSSPIAYYYLDDISVIPFAENLVCGNSAIGPDCPLPGASYSWSPATGLSCTNCANPIANPTIITTYTLTITDANNCSAIANVTVYPPPIVTIQSTNTCLGQNNGTATANITGGTIPYSYSWNNGAVTSNISNLASGIYTVTVTDANGCTDTESIIIATLPKPTANAGPDETICIGSGLTATLGVGTLFPPSCSTATGGTPPYTTYWSMTSTTPLFFASTLCFTTFSSIYSGTYTFTVLVTDANGCTATDQKIITVKTAEQCCTDANFPPLTAGKYKSISVSNNIATITFPNTATTTMNVTSLPASFSVKEKIIFNYAAGGNNNYSLIQKTMEFAPNGSVEIKPGVKVTLDRCTLKAINCNSMWKGVFVQGNPNLGPYQQLGQAVGQGVLVLNTSVVQDAHSGVNNFNITGFLNFNAGGIIQATNSQFFNNRVAAAFLPYTGYALNNNYLRNFFVKCLFETNAPMKDVVRYGTNRGHDSFVWMWRMNSAYNMECSFYFTDNTFRVTAPVPFWERGRGIQSMDSYYCVNRGGPKGGNSFINLLTGIDDNRSVAFTFKPIQVTGNFFSDVTTGIQLTGTGGNYNIKENNFTQSVFVGALQLNPTTGIYDNGASTFRVFDNIFTKHTWGCYVRNSGTTLLDGASGNYLWRNTYNNCYHAVETTGNNSALRVLCNNFNNTANVTQAYWWNSGTVQDPQGVCNNGTTPNEPAGNKFYNAVSLSRIVQSTINAQSFTYNYDNVAGVYFPSYTFQNSASNIISQIQCSQNSNCTGGGPKKIGRPEQQIAQEISVATDKLERMKLIAEMIELHTDNGNFAQIISFLESVPDTEAKWMLVPEYIDKKRYNDAESTLNGLTKDNLERVKKDEFYRVHIELGKTDRKPTDMTVAEKTTVEQVALSETEVSHNAKAMLHFWFNEKYDPVMEIMSSNRLSQPETSEKEIPIYFIDDEFMVSGIYPNPNNGLMKMDYILPENLAVLVKILDITGRIVSEHILIGSGQLQIYNDNLSSGLYFYQIESGDGISIKEKFIIIK